METPSSTRRVTRSQTSAALNNSIPVSKGKNDECEKSVSKTITRNGKQQQERSALIDITNDSPIVGLAMETPSSAMVKQKRAKNMVMTPGSGEALLRGQVKTLLQKVEEEAELSKVSMESRPFLHFTGCVNSPMGLLAPTPANTPQVPNLSEDAGGISNSTRLGSIVMAPPVVEEHLRISEVESGIFDGVKQEVNLESQKSLITRSLLLDFTEKSESSDSLECCSVVTDQGVITGESSACKEKPSSDDDNASICSIQVNPSSTHDEDDCKEAEENDGGLVGELSEEILFRGRHTKFAYSSDEEITNEEMGDDYYEEEQEEDEEDEEQEEEDGGLVDEICEGISKMSMKEMFTGKHTRFLYNSDDEIEGSLDIIRLKGLPTPKGKHLRFPQEELEAD
ncbi:hypothetical protein DITRI_Ditri18aG0116600 [Diplodiscus trichospermus]